MRKALMFVAGFMAGLTAGGIVAMLLAPESGSELQNRIRSGVENLVAEGKAAAETRRLELEEQLESFKQGRPITLQEAEPIVE